MTTDNQSNIKEVKLKLVYKDFDGNIQIESVWAEKIGDYFKIVNIPFFAYNIAYGDIVNADEDDDGVYFNELIEPSGHSTIQMIIYDKNDVLKIGDELVELGCVIVIIFLWILLTNKRKLVLKIRILFFVILLKDILSRFFLIENAGLPEITLKS
jgi:hypothetical protein